MTDPVRVVRRESEATHIYVRSAVLLAAAGCAFAVALVLSLGVGVSRGVGCSACHAMRPYVESAPVSGHGDVGCAACHAASGIAATASNGVRAVSWIVGATLSRSPVPGSVDSRACLSCHDAVREGVITSRGTAVRHSDFLATPCGHCHEGTGHRLGGRLYRAAEMDDCTTCHTTASTNLGGCELCHIADAAEERAEGDTSWRVTHGANWEQTHGMGDMATCSSCHPGPFCARCHGVRLPHPSDWRIAHGPTLRSVSRDACVACHEPDWCTECHGGVVMPHAADFMPDHGPQAISIGEDACLRCHDKEGCDLCHYESSHPNVPGVVAPHGG